MGGYNKQCGHRELSLSYELLDPRPPVSPTLFHLQMKAQSEIISTACRFNSCNPARRREILRVYCVYVCPVRRIMSEMPIICVCLFIHKPTTTSSFIHTDTVYIQIKHCQKYFVLPLCLCIMYFLGMCIIYDSNKWFDTRFSNCNRFQHTLACAPSRALSSFGCKRRARTLDVCLW